MSVGPEVSLSLQGLVAGNTNLKSCICHICVYSEHTVTPRPLQISSLCCELRGCLLIAVVEMVLIFLVTSPLWRDDSDGALLANHVSLHNYPSIYFQDLFLIKSHESELCVLIELLISHVGILTGELEQCAVCLLSCGVTAERRGEETGRLRFPHTRRHVGRFKTN